MSSNIPSSRRRAAQGRRLSGDGSSHAADAESQQREQELRIIYDTVADVIYVLAVEGDGGYRFASVNHAFQTTTGIPVDQVIGKRVEEIIPEPALAVVVGRYAEAIRDRKIVRWEETSDYPTGTLTGDVSIAPVFDEADNCVYLVGAVHDITERKRFEDSLQQREQELRIVYDTVADIINVKAVEEDGGYRYTFVNSAYEKIVGTPPDQVIGKRMEEVVPEPSLSTLRERYAEAVREKRVVRWEETTDYPNGTLIADMTVTPVFNESGQCTHLVCATHDLTERIRSEQALRESEERLRHTLDGMLEGCQIIGFDWRYLYVNDAAARHGRAAKEDLLGKTMMEVYPGVEQSEMYASLRSCMEGRAPCQVESEFTFPDGETGWFELRVSPVPEGIFILSIDVTEQKNLEQQLIQADRLVAIGTLVSGVAHEVNNPLTGAMGLVQLLLRGELEASIRQDLEMVNAEIQRAVSTLRNLLIFAREYTPEKTAVSINEILGSVLDVRSYEMQVNNIQVVQELQPDLPETMADPNQLRQVFLNMIINAQQAMTEFHGRGVLTLRTWRSDDTVSVAIIDDGPGIAREHLNRVFDPFFTTKPIGVGTGLGLSICYGIVREHGGHISVSSAVGEGSAFTIELPIGSGS